MKKIALMSFVENLNYGGSLQAYALEKYIENTYENVSCEYIKYVKKQGKASLVWFGRKILYMILKKDDTPSWTIREYMSIIMDMFSKKNSVNMVENKKLFQRFWMLSNYSPNLTKKALLQTSLDYDLYIVGSDQVWNCGRVDLDTTFLLDFVKENEKKASYAPSLSLKEIPEKYRKKYKKYLSAFQYLSCREKNGARVIEELIKKEVKAVLDPVFLLSVEDWKKVENKSAAIKEERDFIIVYMLHESEVLISCANSYAKSHEIDVVYISGDLSKNNCVGPAEWLWYMRNAKMIFTNSFHGTAFSIIFNVPFWVEVPQKDFFQASSDRIYDLLEMFYLQDRIIDKYELIPREIMYKQVNEVLRVKRKESQQYIASMM